MKLYIVLTFTLFFILFSFYYSKTKTKYSYSNKSIMCDIYYIKNKKHFDTINRHIFNDEDIRSQLFPTFKEIYPKINNNDCIFDIGSNIGDITYQFNKYYPNNRFYLAEPLEQNCIRTQKRFIEFKNIYIINTAIGFNRHSIIWNYPKIGSMMHVSRLLFSSNVTFIGLDSFYSKYTKNGDIFFLKIDVEGFEDEVLFSGMNLLSQNKIKMLYLEYHYTCKTISSYLVLYLNRLGYNCYLVGKYKIIPITINCIREIDIHKLSHIICFSKNINNEYKFVKAYNKKFFINYFLNYG